jgi:hypothetical protein
MAHKDMVPGAWDGHDGLGNDWSKLGGCIAHNYFDAMPHCYLKQVVTGLTPLASYECGAWMVLMTRGAWATMIQVYMEVLGGAAGNISRKTPYVTDNANNNPGGWKRYVVTNTASASGKLEIRLHYNVIEARPLKIWEYRNLDAYYDHVSVIPAGQTEYLPPYNILAFERANQDIMLKWQTVMNNRYRIQASQNVSDPNAWKMLERELNVDTNYFATGTNYTFRTNMGGLFYYNPPATIPQYFDPNLPLFFRIHSTSFTP